MIIRRR